MSLGKRKSVLVIVTLWCLTGVSVVWGTERVLTDVYLAPQVQAQSLSDANVVYTGVTTTGCSSQKLYINYEDKDMFALVLTARALNSQVDIWYEDAAPTKSFGIGDPLTCQVIWIAMDAS